MLKRLALCSLLVATPVAADECKPEIVYIDTNRAVRILEAMGLTEVRAEVTQAAWRCPDGGAPVLFFADGVDGKRVGGVVCLTAESGVVRFGP